MTDVAFELGLRQPVFSGSATKGHIRETVGLGACWIDHDGDDDLDLFLPNGGRQMPSSDEPAEPRPAPWRLYENVGGDFVDRREALGAPTTAWGVGCAVGDVDADGRDDLYVTAAEGGSRLLRNVGGSFVDAGGPSGTGIDAFTSGALFFDREGDADLDLFVTAYLDESRPPPGPCFWKGAPVTCGPKGFPPLDALLFVNDGRGHFELASPADGIAGHPGYGLGAVSLDADGDGDTDLFAANDSSPNHLFLNRGDGAFEERGLLAGVALSPSGMTQASMGVDAGDLDGDGAEDLVVTNFSDDVHNFFRRDAPALFSDRSRPSGLAQASFSSLGWAVLLEDFDLDRDLDVFLANGHVYPGVEDFDPNTTYLQRLQLLFNDGTGRFSEELGRLGPDFAAPFSARGAAPADFDGDGDVDLLVVRDGEAPLLLRNDLAPPGARWLKVRLRGSSANREGIGATVEVEDRYGRQVREMRRSRGYLSSGPAELVFGLGPSERVDRLRVRWPGSAGEQTCRGVAVNRTLTVAEGADCVPSSSAEAPPLRRGAAHGHQREIVAPGRAVQEDGELGAAGGEQLGERQVAGGGQGSGPSPLAEFLGAGRCRLGPAVGEEEERLAWGQA